MNEYLSVSKEAFYEFTERRSRFIGYIKPVKTEQEAIDFTNEIKEKHKDATHNVYAYILRENQKTRYSDDGEPHKTAGLPVLEVLQKNNLVDVAAVVTRYFGGTLLGTGGLVRAYTNAIIMAVKVSKIVKFKLCSEIELFCDYNQYGKLLSTILLLGGVVIKTDFTQNVFIKFHISSENTKTLKNKILEITAGEVHLKIIKEKFYII